MDHDCVVLDGSHFGRYCTDRVAAKRVDADDVLRRFDHDTVEELQGLGYDLASDPLVNSGVVIVPQAVSSLVLETWLTRAAEAVAILRHPVAEQIGLSWALKDLDLWSPLPRRLNQTAWRKLSSRPGLVHYNDASVVNREVKEQMTTVDAFVDLIARADSSFWRKYSPRVRQFIDTNRERVEEVRSFLLYGQ